MNTFLPVDASFPIDQKSESQADFEYTIGPPLSAESSMITLLNGLFGSTIGEPFPSCMVDRSSLSKLRETDVTMRPFGEAMAT